jgi:hypothetical protein
MSPFASKPNRPCRPGKARGPKAAATIAASVRNTHPFDRIENDTHQRG